MNIVPASSVHFEKAIALLQQNQLPVDDIHTGTQLFIAEENNDVIGTIAVEYDYDTALLRSLSVAPGKREKGIGIELVKFIEDYVKQQGVREIYLLTTTAADFFTKRNYVSVERSGVPDFIRQTSEFSGICPSTATVMKKTMEAPGLSN